MCLMCEYYRESCDDPECIAAVEDSYNIYNGRTITLFLNRGDSEPCKHMIERHGAECPVIKKHETKYGLIYDECDCY